MANQRRYNAGVQRAKGLLEMAAALYDTSLSNVASRGTAGVTQVDSRMGSRVSITVKASNARPNAVDMTLTAGGFVDGLEAVAKGELSLLWMNPSVALTMAHRGTGPFKQPLPLRAIAVFPSPDAMAFAVRRSSGITSIKDIVDRKLPLKVSTREAIAPPFHGDCTMYAVDAILRAAGASLPAIQQWGGELRTVPRPSDGARMDHISSGWADAVFDEGVPSWAPDAIANDFEFLPIEGEVQDAMAALGFRASFLRKEEFPGLKVDVPTVDFSGWPMVVHADMPGDVAYALCETLELRRDAIPTDNFKPLDLQQLVGDDGECPLDAPLHPGAERFYRERGLL
jgi:TRAP-type uncharacterized transport system substrate-binding protein